MAKFLFITADDTPQAANNHALSTNNIEAYLDYILRRINLKRDIHFYTNTTIDTLDYSGEGLNSGSKVVLAAYGEPLRSLGTVVPSAFYALQGFTKPQLVLPGIIVLQTAAFTTYEAANKEMEMLNDQLSKDLTHLNEYPFLIICDNADFVSDKLNNFLWVTFTRCNPSHDMYGIDSFTQLKHWGCNGPLVFDARIKPHHAPPVEKDAAVEKSIDRIFEKGGSLYHFYKH